MSSELNNTSINIENQVRAWYENVIIPTYGIGKPEKNPMFLEKRVYQGSSGVVYPHPVIEKILDEKKDKEWNAIYLENQYLRIMILPELGGRIQMAYDKTSQRHFVYYNQVIKPALVGLTGPWISGGIEFNWPQHHRPSTYQPVDHCIEKNEDGSITVWCSELERMFGTKGMAGFTLHPDKAYLEIKVKLFNRSDLPQSFLWWANPAVKVNDDYHSVFPPDVNAVFDHGKRDVSEFPIAKGTYYKVDYSPGTDISRYKNIPVPTSYMAVDSKYNFVGGYENDTKGGLLHVANHHISPGKKQWTWGHSDFGKAWDRNLTDEDGPYIELMCGVFTDNQPDFSWLMPGEEKTFSQYFMPYRDLGVVKNASKDAMVNLEFQNGKAKIRAYATADYSSARVVLGAGDQILSDDEFDFHPATSYAKTIEIPGGIDLQTIEIKVLTYSGKTLVSWRPESGEEKLIPSAAKAARLPKDIDSNEQLYLTGLHLEQYRHPTYNPCDYYLEALIRDPKDARCNNALGLWNLRRGQFGIAEDYFRNAIATLTERNPNPLDGEPLYNLGLALNFQGRKDEAYDAFFKSVWNAAYMETGYFELARIASGNQKWEEALDLVDKSLIRNWHNHKSRQLKVSILRKLGRISEATKWIEDSLQLDKFNFGILFEQCCLNPDTFEELTSLLRGNIHNYIAFALDFACAGLFDEAISLIQTGISVQKENQVYPMAFYYKAWFEFQNGQVPDSLDSLKNAVVACSDYCFPNKPEDVVVLEWAKKQNPDDSKAPYYLGNFWYNALQYKEAVKNWELSLNLNDRFPTVRRNLALAYFNKLKATEKALSELEKAFALDQTDSRILMELDQLYKRLEYSSDFRLQNLEKHLNLVLDRDDLYLERAALCNSLGLYEKAFELIIVRRFHPWEGGEGKVTGQYVFSLTEQAKKAISLKSYKEAVELLLMARHYPENLGEGKLFGAQENAIYYWLGCAYEGLGLTEKAIESWNVASAGMNQPGTAIFYNDQQSDSIYYQGLALNRLGKKSEAKERFEMLIHFGEIHLNDEFKLDYFAVSLPDLQIWDDDLSRRNNKNCQELIALGKLGMSLR